MGIAEASEGGVYCGENAGGPTPHENHNEAKDAGADGALLLYTTAEHRVEYWLASNLSDPTAGAAANATQRARASEASAPYPNAKLGGPGISPVAMHHR